jgi:hypothetical protein
LGASETLRDSLESMLGVNSYIQKPVDFNDFRDTVKQLGLYWLVVNQPPPPPSSFLKSNASETDE